MNPFSNKPLRDFIEKRKQEVYSEIDKLSNEVIMANDLSILANNCYEKHYIAKLQMQEEDTHKRTITQEKIYVQGYNNFRYASSTSVTSVDGVSFSFSYPFTGDAFLFDYRASTYLVSAYPQIELLSDCVVLKYSFPLTDIDEKSGYEKVFKQLENDISSIKTGIEYTNADVSNFNTYLSQSIISQLQSKKAKVEKFFSLSKAFEIPIEKNEFAGNHIAVVRRIQPIKEKYENKPNYYISDKEYNDIISIIKNNGSTYERTPSTFNGLGEEDIRNLIVASLNGYYKGAATGETFRKKGKTDICIEFENRSAFVAECKIWKGQGKVSEALHQLDSYLTWRDCKTALIYFVRNKDFLAIVDTMKKTVESNIRTQRIECIDQNEISCDYASESNPGQKIKIRIILFSLPINE